MSDLICLNTHTHTHTHAKHKTQTHADAFRNCLSVAGASILATGLRQLGPSPTCCSLNPDLICTHTHTHIYTHSHSHSHIRTHTHTHTHADADASSNFISVSGATILATGLRQLEPSRTCCSHNPDLICSHTYTYTRSHSHSHTHSLPHTQMPPATF